MLIIDPRRIIRLFILCSALVVPSMIIAAQTPTPTPSPGNPAQRDAARPPGTEQSQPVPPEARPNTQNPAAPPNTQQPPAQAPPGTNVAPQTPAQQTPPPTTQPSPANPTEQTVPSVPTANQEQEPNIPPVQPRPVPPLPNLTRLGITPGQVLSLSLNDAIKRALQNNNDIEVARDDVRYAETQLRSFQGVYDPIFAITPTYDHRITPQSSTLGGGGTAGTVTSTALTVSPTLTKQFSRGGGTYELSFSNTRSTTSSTFANLSPTYASNLSLIFTQPLWRNRSIDANRHTIRIQKKRVEQSDADFRRKTIDVISQVQSAYWDLVFALRDQQVQLDNVNLSRENLRQIEAQIAAGAKAPLDRAEVLTELANREQTLLSANQTVSIAENVLKQLMLKDPTMPDWSAQITPTDAPVVDTNPVNLNDAIAEARKNRPELQRLRLQREINDIDIQFFKNQTKPQMDLQATLATTGLAGSTVSTVVPGTQVPLISGNPNTSASAFLLQQIQNIQAANGLPVATSPLVTLTSSTPTNLIGGYGKDLGNLLNFGTRNITIGVAIQLPLKNTTAKANLAGAQIQKEQLDASVRSTEQLVEVDVRNAAQAVESARQRVLTARDARSNAEVQLEGEQRLYSVGRSTTFLLIQRQNTLANARDQEMRAETDYTKAVSNLQHATSTTLHSNNVIVDSPVRP
jgi:outer membrane protein